MVIPPSRLYLLLLLWPTKLRIDKASIGEKIGGVFGIRYLAFDIWYRSLGIWRLAFGIFYSFSCIFCSFDIKISPAMNKANALLLHLWVVATGPDLTTPMRFLKIFILRIQKRPFLWYRSSSIICGWSQSYFQDSSSLISPRKAIKVTRLIYGSRESAGGEENIKANESSLYFIGDCVNLSVSNCLM